jgi:hypothetical protein
MKTRYPFLLSGALAALVVPALASAAAATHQCSQLWDDALRLNCYDMAFGKPRAPESAASATTAPASSAAPVVVAPAAAGIAATTATAPVSAATPPAGAASPEKAKQSDSVVTTVTAIGKTLDGRFRATLDNGQVWQQLELYPPVTVKVGDRVTLRRASFGSHQLVVPGGLSARVTQVNK